MAKKTTRDAALRSLFGNESTTEEPEGSKTHPDFERDPNLEEREVELGTKSSQESTVAAPKIDLTDRSNSEGEGTAARRSGYLGGGKYARDGEVVERITPYVRPDQAEALRIAVATKRDPRGRDMSQIVQSLLDEAGYRQG